MFIRRDLLKSLGVVGAAVGTSTFPAWPQSGPRRGGMLNVVMQPEPATLILAINQQTPTNQVSAKMFQGLFVYGFDLKPIPNLAELLGDVIGWLDLHVQTSARRYMARWSGVHVGRRCLFLPKDAH